MFLPLRRARWPLHTKMGRICKVAVEMTRLINRGESQTGYSPALGNPHQTRVPTFPQRRRRRGAWQRRGQTPLKSGSLPDSCTEPKNLYVGNLPHSTTEPQLRALFEAHGAV